VKAWYVIHTHAHAETKALQHLSRQGYAAYLPCFAKWRRHARRRERVSRPLFPRYLFVALDNLDQRWRPILSTVGVRDLLRLGERPVPVPEGLVEAIQRRERDGVLDGDPAVAGLAEGDEVRIMSGPFADLVGRFCSMADEQRVMVLLDLLGRPVKTCLPSEAIAPA
jgi:transcriptional antiterminator RfaH